MQQNIQPKNQGKQFYIMKRMSTTPGYESPFIREVGILTEAILCTSSGNDFKATLEDMKENDYTFNW